MPSLPFFALSISCFLGAQGHADDVQLIQFTGAGQAPRSGIYRLPKELKIIADKNATAEDFKKHDKLRSLLSTDKTKSTSDQFPMGPMLSPTQIQGLVTVTMVGIRYADEGITRIIEQQEKWFDQVTSMLGHCTELVNQVDDKGLEVKDVSMISKKTMHEIDDITYCVKDFAQFALDEWPNLFKIQDDVNGKLYNYTTAGEGRMIPGIDEFAEQAWSPEATHRQQSGLIDPVKQALTILNNGTKKTKQDKINVLFNINVELEETIGAIYEFGKVFREVQEKHEEYKFLDDIRASPLGFLAPPQLFDVLRAVVFKFHKSANISLAIMDSAQEFSDSMKKKNIIAVGAASALRAGVLSAVLAVLVALRSW